MLNNQSKNNVFKQFWPKFPITILLIIALGALPIALFTKAYFAKQDLLSPIDQLSRFRFIQTRLTHKPKTKKLVYGFLPYWNLDRFKLNPTLTHLAYFRLTIDQNGKIKTKSKDKPEIGYARLRANEFLKTLNQLEKNQTKFEVVFAVFDPTIAKNLLNSNSAQENFFKELDSLILAYPVSGINLDVELDASSGAKLRPKFTQFVAKLNRYLKRKPQTLKLSIDVYSSAVEGNNIWDLTKLANEVDYIVLMAYDFHQRNSNRAGPVAPIFGGGDIFTKDIHNYLKETLKKIPANKLLLGVPFYGYQWQTVNDTAYAQTYPNTGQAVFYSQVVKLLKKPEVKRSWNSRALSPYLTFKKDGKHYVLYYEDKNSLHYKLELVNQLDLAGIAIWALGYEGDSPELWQKITQNLSN